MDILSQLPQQDIEEFTEDFSELLRVFYGIRKEYSKITSDAGKKIKEFSRIIFDFNKKYGGVELQLKKTPEDLSFKIFLKEKSIKDAFGKAASRLEGLRSVGANEPEKAKVEEMEKFSKEVEKAASKIHISYADGQIVLRTAGENLIEVVFSEGILNQKGPEFKLCTYYAVSGGIKAIELYSRLSAFGFMEQPNFDDWMDYYRKFNPKIEE